MSGDSHWAPWIGVASDRLTAEGVPVSELADRFGTPLWVISRATIEANYERFLAAFRDRYPRTDVAYSMKANSALAIIRILSRAGAKIDCSSEYEIALAERAGAAGRDIVVNGNGKSDGTLLASIARGVHQVNADSIDEIARLDAAAGEAGSVVDCAVRVQLGYERLLAEDPSFESTLRVGEGKFGNNIANGDAMRAVAAVANAANLRFVGLHHHVGFSGYMGDYSPEREVLHHRVCTEEICDFAAAVRGELGFGCEQFDLGGGFRTGERIYLSSPGDGSDGAFHPLPAIGDYVDAIAGTIERRMDPADRPALLFETGGYQVANAAMFVTSVVETKEGHGPDRRTAITVDGSMQMFTSKGTMRVASEVVPAERPTAPAAPGIAYVVGQTCVYDSLAEAIALPPLAPGDVLALLDHGAYCDTTGTQMNSFPRPAAVLLDDGRPVLVRRRETLDEVAGRDLLPNLYRT